MKGYGSTRAGKAVLDRACADHEQISAHPQCATRPGGSVPAKGGMTEIEFLPSSDPNRAAVNMGIVVSKYTSRDSNCGIGIYEQRTYL